MKSDTPRIDAAELHVITKGPSVVNNICYIDEARKIERELNAANQRIKRLEEAGDQLAKHALAGGVPQLFIEFVENWYKAKEAKP